LHDRRTGVRDGRATLLIRYRRRLKFIKFMHMTRDKGTEGLTEELKNIEGEMPYMTEEMDYMTREVGYMTGGFK
jgi:hypothetical protein